mmetsp:Transcript_1036/g.3042  ORF Transcript_1036/g.3042 Transcript_1036/m.3042 type:complete len:202 (-) Transcript_1036:208-813(-)
MIAACPSRSGWHSGIMNKSTSALVSPSTVLRSEALSAASRRSSSAIQSKHAEFLAMRCRWLRAWHTLKNSELTRRRISSSAPSCDVASMHALTTSASCIWPSTVSSIEVLIMRRTTASAVSLGHGLRSNSTSAWIARPRNNSKRSSVELHARSASLMLEQAVRTSPGSMLVSAFRRSFWSFGLKLSQSKGISIEGGRIRRR